MLSVARLKTIVEYIAVQRQSAAAHVVWQPILEVCRATERMRGTPPPVSFYGIKALPGIWLNKPQRGAQLKLQVGRGQDQLWKPRQKSL
jgi:hypothetical protein